MEFAEELARFRQRTGQRRFGGLVLLGTGQPTTAALLLGTLDVDRVGFLLTKETTTMPAQVAALLGRTADDWDLPDGDHEPIAAVYRGLHRLIKQWDLPRHQIAVDVTGGTKPMSLGLDKAAYALGLTTIYIQSDYEEVNGRRSFIPGTQRIETPPDPFTVFGDLEADEAKRLWRTHDYIGAQRIFATLAERVDPADRPRYAALATLANAYHCWNEFALTDAAAHLTTLLATPLADELAPFATALGQQVSAVGRLATTTRDASGSDSSAALWALADRSRVLDLLGTLHGGALRNEKRQDFDTAALLRYRCLELMGQHRLATWDILSERPDFTRALGRVPDLNARFEDIEDRVGFRPRGLPYPGRNNRIPPLALFNSYMVLAALDDALVRGYDIRQIKDRSEARNKSILAHGYRLIDEATYARFATVVDALLDRLLALYALDRATWQAESAFVQPFGAALA